MAEGVKMICLDCGQANRVPADRLDAKPICGTCGKALVDGNPHEVGFTQMEKIIRKDDLPVVVDFWAPWCGPCRMMAPAYAQAAEMLKGKVRFLKVNTQEFPEAATAHRIQGIPALILFKGGREAGRLVGARPAGDIAAFARQGLTQSA